MSTAIQWLDKAENHDYPAAESYLSLLFDDVTCIKMVKWLREADMSQFKG